MDQIMLSIFKLHLIGVTNLSGGVMVCRPAQASIRAVLSLSAVYTYLVSRTISTSHSCFGRSVEVHTLMFKIIGLKLLKEHSYLQM